MRNSALQRRLDDATALAATLFKRTGLAATPTVDGRVLIYAPRKKGEYALDLVQTELRHSTRTAVLVPIRDPRLAVVEVSGA